MISFSVVCIPAFCYFQLMEKRSETHGTRRVVPFEQEMSILHLAWLKNSLVGNNINTWCKARENMAQGNHWTQGNKGLQNSWRRQMRQPWENSLIRDVEPEEEVEWWLWVKDTCCHFAFLVLQTGGGIPVRRTLVPAHIGGSGPGIGGIIHIPGPWTCLVSLRNVNFLKLACQRYIKGSVLSRHSCLHKSNTLWISLPKAFGPSSLPLVWDGSLVLWKVEMETGARKGPGLIWVFLSDDPSPGLSQAPERNLERF